MIPKPLPTVPLLPVTLGSRPTNTNPYPTSTRGGFMFHRVTHLSKARVYGILGLGCLAYTERCTRTACPQAVKRNAPLLLPVHTVGTEYLIPRQPLSSERLTQMHKKRTTFAYLPFGQARCAGCEAEISASRSRYCILVFLYATACRAHCAAQCLRPSLWRAASICSSAWR